MPLEFQPNQPIKPIVSQLAIPAVYAFTGSNTHRTIERVTAPKHQPALACPLARSVTIATAASQIVFTRE